MDHLPTDPMMLLSTVNTMLRDGQYASLEDLCKAMGTTRQDVEQRLRDAGFEYNSELKKFW